MKPLEGSMVDGEGEIECEMHSKDFFVEVGMLIMEGRTPVQSEKGRVEGKHCPSLAGTLLHHCDGANVKENVQCQEALSWKQLMELQWQNEDPLVIDVDVQLSDKEDSTLLLEQWVVELVSSTNSNYTSGSVLMQAVRSHIHFSQLSAWLSRSKGTQPRHINYKIRQSGKVLTDTFIRDPVSHFFPLASLPGNSALCVMVKSLPRCDINELLEELQVKLHELHFTENRPDSLQRPESSNSVLRTLDAKAFDSRSPLRKKTCLEKYEISRLEFLRQEKLDNAAMQVKRSSLFCTLSASKSEKVKTSSLDRTLNSASNGISNLEARISKLSDSVSQIDNNLEAQQLHKGFHGPKRSVVNRKLEHVLDHCKDPKNTCDTGKEKSIVNMVLERKWRSYSEENAECRDLSKVAATALRKITKDSQDAKPNSPSDQQCCTRQGAAHNSCDVDIHAIRHPVDRKACNFRRSVQLPIGACTEPVFNQKTGLPISSSPAPFRRSTTELDEDDTNFTNGLSNKVEYRELAKILSRSAPASTTQSLLGNFEESVLNGRMEPVGTVEGFTAELSASGSFCPPHVKLPINSYFYRLSDDDAPSPYMGYISLDEEPIGRKGYHVPKKGTIQLIVFNPNKTVVKIFVALFDFSDMPPKSQTFLRQKTFTVLKGNTNENEVHPSLSYLLHLRFASSKSGSIYLHTDIRVIFARQPPDLGSIYQLCTVTDGPTDPKYTPRYHIT